MKALFIDRERKLMEIRKDKVTAEAKVQETQTLLTETRKRVLHTQNVINQANQLLAAAINMETGVRGFLLSGDNAFLEPYEAGGKDFMERIQALSQTVSDNPPQVALFG